MYMRRIFRLAAPVCAMLVATSIVLTPGGYLDKVFAQTASFLETFDGTPPVPLAYNNPNNWEIFVQGVNSQEVAAGSSIAQHGPNCEAPGFPYTPQNSHPITGPQDAVFICNGHVMTAMGITGYGAIYMTPPALLNFRTGQASLTWDMSTLRTAARDWVDIVLTPYSQHQMMAYNNNDQHVPPDNIHIQLAGGGNVLIASQRVAGGVDVPIGGDGGTTWDMVQAAQSPPLRQDAARRDSFEVDLTSTHLRVCITGNNIPQTYTYRGRQGFCWIDTDLPTPLSDNVWAGQSTVQLDHRDYNPEKSCTSEDDFTGIVHSALGDLTCPPDTWHWDNVRINPSVPYTIIRSSQPYHLSNPAPQTVNFVVPAPANTNLEFVTFGMNSALQVSFDGGASWRQAVFQPSLATGHDENGEMVWMPIPQGVSSIQVRGNYGFWGGYDANSFNLVSASAGVVIPTPAAIPTSVGSVGNGTSGAGNPSTSTPVAQQTPRPTNTPTATSTPTATPTVFVPRSLALNGSNGFAEVAAATAPGGPGVGDWTVELWVKDDDSGGFDHDYRYLIDKGDGVGAESPFYMLLGNGEVLAGLRDGGTNYPLRYSLTNAHTNASLWHHFAATFQSSSRTMTLFLDGAQVGRQAMGHPSVGNALPFEIGRQGPTNSKNWLGKIDDVRIWNMQRTAAQIQGAYRTEFTGTVPVGLVSNWRFDEGTGTTANNFVPSGGSARLQPGATYSSDIHP
jgi:Concanavalin A-like lectin/glucanases superfamily